MIKRLFDLLFSISILIMLIPVILIVAFLVFIKMGWPIIFSQLRPGKGGKPFKIYKFRSMIDRLDKRGVQLPDAKRLTQFGQFLRSTSCDELPTLWNVLRGEMSIVGPRPLLMEYLPLYNKKQSRRHEVKPGITGWAQVNGRNAISWKEKFDFDIWYVNHHSFWLDLKIIFLTIKKIFLKEGIAEPGRVTMSKFKGNKK